MMRRLLHDERGFTLIELLMASVIMIVVISATLNALDTATATSTRNQKLVDTIDRARLTMETLSKKLRNATAYQTTASPTSASIVRATSNDIAFKVVDPFSAGASGNSYAVQTIRYCLETSTGKLWTQRKADAVVPGASCPDLSWSTRSVVATDITNAARPVFTYDSATLSDISSVGISLFLDTTPGKAPAETSLSSGVFLRNQNRRPTAAFTALTSTVGQHVQLNGSNSIDPEGQLLTYQWSDGSTVLSQNSPVVDYVATTPGAHTFTLTVTDVGGLTDTTTQTVTVS
jgi:prepilin-type N-terminal cleavage/methylation domain-containing protein